MALSFALHGLAIVPLLLAATSGSAPLDEPAFMVELALAAPAPTEATTPGDAQPSQHGVELPTPDEPPPVDTADITPPPTVSETRVEPPAPEQPMPEAVAAKVDLPAPDHPPPVEVGEIADKKVELPQPEEPPPLAMADIKPPVPPKPVEAPKPQAQPTPKPTPKPAAPPTPAAARPAQKPAVTQTESAPSTGTDRVTQSADATAPLAVSQHPRFRTRRPAPYPPRAIELGQQGDVVFRVRLQPDGSVAEIVLWRSSGHELLDRSALATVRGYEFLPMIHNGQAVAAWVEFPIRFHLR